MAGQNVDSDFKDLKGTVKKCSYAIVEVGDKKQGSSNMLERKKHEFRVGDFVWTKIKTYPWWPGQIYDTKDASDFAVKHGQENRILVAFFGDGSCAWCLPSQLIPFSENFKQKSTEGSTNNFFKAIREATNGIGRVVEANMICKCIPLEKRDDLKRQVAENAGVKPGVLVPEVDIQRLNIPEYNSAEIVSKVSNLAKGIRSGNALDIAVLKSWISAFYYSKGGYRLPVCNEKTVYIEGLEDKDNSVAVVDGDFSVPIVVPVLDPLEDKDNSVAVSAAKKQPLCDDKVYCRRMQKNVADLMAENQSAKLKIRKIDTIKERKEIGMSLEKKKEKRNDREVVKVGSSVGKKGSKVKLNDKVSKALVVKKEQIEVAFAENTCDGGKRELENVSTIRERKRSKYLSPPYTNPPSRVGNLRSVIKAKSDKKKLVDVEVKGLAKSGAVKHGNNKLTFPMSDVNVPVNELLSDKKKLVNIEVKGLDKSGAVKHGNDKLTFPMSDVNVPVNELLSEIQFVAVNPRNLSKKGSLDMVSSFVSAFKSSTNSRGSNCKIYRKFSETVKKRKSQSQLGNNQENGREPKKPRKETPRPSKFKKAAEISSALILKFEPGFPLPTKEEIEGQFGKFGKLDEKETIVVSGSNSVWIVYMNRSDAEKAFKSCVSESPFRVENVNYYLQHSSGGSKFRRDFYLPPPKKAANDDLMSDVGVIKQKIEIMTAIMDNYRSKFSAEEKISLKEEMKKLTENVEAASEKVSVMAENASLLKVS